MNSGILTPEMDLSPYSADDSDNYNERGNYWRSWEASERLASMTICDFQVSCWLCPNAFGNSDDWEGSGCEKNDLLPINEFFSLETPDKQPCDICGNMQYNRICGKKCETEFKHMLRHPTPENVEKLKVILGVRHQRRHKNAR